MAKIKDKTENTPRHEGLRRTVSPVGLFLKAGSPDGHLSRPVPGNFFPTVDDPVNAPKRELAAIVFTDPRKIRRLGAELTGQRTVAPAVRTMAGGAMPLVFYLASGDDFLLLGGAKRRREIEEKRTVNDERNCVSKNPGHVSHLPGFRFLDSLPVQSSQSAGFLSIAGREQAAESREHFLTRQSPLAAVEDCHRRGRRL